MQQKALVFIADGTEEIEVITAIDVLRRGGVDVTIAAVKNETTVVCSRGVKIVADDTLEHVVNTKKIFDAVIIPGGATGAEKIATCEMVKTLLKKFEQEKKIVAAICAGPLALKTAGVFRQRRITTHPSIVEVMAHDFKVNKEKRVEIDGNLITSQGPGTALEFALTVLEKLRDEKLMHEVASPLIVHPSVQV